MTNREYIKAVIFDGPFKVSVQDQPIPAKYTDICIYAKVEDNRDVILKVTATALCGSNLHLYRGLEPSEPGCIMGHEVTGVVVEAGKGVETVEANVRL
ncbi:Fc.00g001010.m01.CDS01 [Cosmosporella sp. VM-42]